jgi:undecaprenyl pyrophosphate phosphatase UppP
MKMDYGLILAIVIVILVIILTFLIILIIGASLDNESPHKSGLISFTTFLSTLIIGGIIVLYTYIMAKSRRSDDEVSDIINSYGIEYVEDILL